MLLAIDPNGGSGVSEKDAFRLALMEFHVRWLKLLVEKWGEDREKIEGPVAQQIPLLGSEDDSDETA